MLLKKYAELIIKVGIALKKDEYVLIQAPIEAVDFARELQLVALQEGARDVYINWSDDYLSCNRFKFVKEEVLLEDANSFKTQERIDLVLNKKTALISITSPTPGVMSGID